MSRGADSLQSLHRPAIKTMPAPPSIQEGLRLNYYGSVGDIPNDDYTKWPDDAGGWIYGTAPSGHGYTQVDIVALSQGVAAVTVQGWQYSDWTGPLIPIRGGQSGLICYAGGGDWWVHPQVLAQVQEVQSEEFAVVKVNQVLDGVSYPAIRIQRVTAEGRQATVYDLRTGLLLFKNAAVKRANTTFASQMFYKGSRKLLGAGGGSPIPAWLKAGLQLDYQGTYMAQVAWGAPFSLPLDALVQIQLVGDRWFYYDQTTTLGSIAGLPPTVEKASLVGGGNIYVAPATLQALQAGTILDTDPITGAQLKVGDASVSVTLQAVVGALSFTEFRYDPATGLMTGFQSWDSTDPLYHIESQVELARLPDFNVGLKPTLLIRRQGQRFVLTCENGGTLTYNVEASEDGAPWRALGQLNSGQPWEIERNAAVRSAFFRLRQ